MIRSQDALGPCGLVILDKPEGLTSFQASRAVGRLLGQKRVGHTGTLDPMATGVLPILVGEATKLAGHLLAETKAYEARICFGTATDSFDRTGRVIETADASMVTGAAVESVLPRFVGTIEQQVPIFSAVRVGGERLHRLARRGIAGEAPRRKVEIFELSLLEFLPGPPPEVWLAVRCSAGTYVRTLAVDLGRALSTVAHLSALRRVAAGAFVIAEAVTLDALTPASLRPPEQALPEAARLLVPGWAAAHLRNGGWLNMASLLQAEAVPSGDLATETATDAERPWLLFDADSDRQLVCIARRVGDTLRPVRVLLAS